MSLIFPPRPEDFKFVEAKSPSLRIVSYSDATRNITIRGVTSTGLIHDSYSTTPDRIAQTRIIALTEIPLSVQVETKTVEVRRGRLYATITLELSGIPIVTLAADYIVSGTPLSWPGSQFLPPTQGNGYIFNQAISSPAAGANFAFTSFINTIFRVHSLNFKFYTNVAVATRTARFRHSAFGVTVYPIFSPSTSQTASLTREYQFNYFNNVPSAFGEFIFGEMVPFFIRYGDTIDSVIENIQADDQLSAIKITVEQWFSP